MMAGSVDSNNASNSASVACKESPARAEVSRAEVEVDSTAKPSRVTFPVLEIVTGTPSRFTQTNTTAMSPPKDTAQTAVEQVNASPPASPNVKEKSTSPDDGKKTGGASKRAAAVLKGQTKVSAYFKPAKNDVFRRLPAPNQENSVDLTGESDDDDVLIVQSKETKSSSVLNMDIADAHTFDTKMKRASKSPYNDEVKFSKAWDKCVLNPEHATLVSQAQNTTLVLAQLGYYDGKVLCLSDKDYYDIIDHNKRAGTRAIEMHPYTVRGSGSVGRSGGPPKLSEAEKKASLKAVATGIGMETLRLTKVPTVTPKKSSPKGGLSSEEVQKIRTGKAKKSDIGKVTAKMMDKGFEDVQASHEKAFCSAGTGFKTSSILFERMKGIHTALNGPEKFCDAELYDQVMDLREHCIEEGFMPRGIPDVDSEDWFRRCWHNCMRAYTIGDDRSFARYVNECLMWSHFSESEIGEEAEGRAEVSTGEKISEEENAAKKEDSCKAKGDMMIVDV